MPRKPRYRALIALAHAIAFCLITTATTESVDSVIGREPIDPQDVTLLEELRAWVSEGETAFDLPLSEAITARQQSFDLFRRYHAESDRQTLARALPFGPTLTRAAERHGVDSLLLASIVETESSFDPEALSYRGAVGLMQVMPATAGADPATLADPELNLNVGARYLAWLLELYDGDLRLALAAYNAGPGAVQRFGGIPPYRETQQYVEKVLRLYVSHHRALWQRSENGDLLALL